MLTPVTDPFDAMAADAPKIHEGGNLVASSVVQRGDVDGALASAVHVASDTFRTQSIEHAFLEPEASLAVPMGAVGPDGVPVTRHRVHVYSPGQGAWEDRRQIASFLALPASDVRVTQVSTGGAFGGKEDLSVQGQAALLALRTGRPVMLRLSRRESLRFHVKRHPMWLDYTAGCDAEGRLVAVRARIVGDNGAYASVGGKVLERAAGHACGPYRVPNVDVEARAVYTNNPPSGAMRGFGANQAAFAVEGVLDMLAERVGIDGWEIRWRNALDVGDRFATGQKLDEGVGVRATLLAVRDAYRGARYAGIACGVKNTGVGNGLPERGRAVLRPEADGTVTLFHSWTEMGQGVHTVLRQLAAQELGIPAERIRVVVDTTDELDTGETTASRATMLGGRAVLRRLHVPCRPRSTGDALEDLAGREFRVSTVVDWTTKLEAGTGEPVTHFAYGWATQVVILDDDGRIERVVAAHDVGGRSTPSCCGGRSRAASTWAWAWRSPRTFRVVDGVPVTDTLKSLGHHPGRRDAAGRGDPRRGAAAGGPATARRAWARRCWSRRRPRWPARCHAFDGVRRTRLPMSDSAAARALLPRLAREAAGRRDTGRDARHRRWHGGHLARPGAGRDRGDVVIEGGRVSPGRSRRRTCPVIGRDGRIDAGGCLVIPGNVCAHTHLYSALARGMPYELEPPRDFVEMLRRIWWRLDRGAGRGIRSGPPPSSGGMEALLAGTTTLVDHHASPHAIDGSLDVVAEALAALGIRSVLAYEVSDRDGPESRAAGVRENRRFAGRVAGGALPLARVDDRGARLVHAVRRDARRLCRGRRGDGDGLHVHVAEDAADEADARPGIGFSVVERLVRARALDGRSLLAHGVHLDAREAQTVRETGATVVHNARSNMNNAVGRAPLGRLGRARRPGHGRHRCRHVRGVAGGLLPGPGGRRRRGPALGAGAARGVVHASSAAAFGEPLLGRIEAGAPADLVVLDHAAPTPLDADSFAGHWVFGLSARHVRDVIVAGDVAVRDRRLELVGQDWLIDAARAEASRLWTRLAAIGEHPFAASTVAGR